MEQTGKVIRLSGENAVVSVKRMSACGENCGHCSVVADGGKCSAKTAVATCENLAGAKPGDNVKIEADSNKVLFAAIVFYMLPCVFAIIGAIVLHSFFNKTYITVLGAVLSALIAFGIVKTFEKKLTPPLTITEIL